jgi:hypothetical protein
MGRITMSRRGFLFGAVALCAAGLAAAPAAYAGPARLSSDGRAAWRLNAGGTPERVSLLDGAVARPPAGAPSSLIALAGPAGGRLFGIAPSADSKSTTLVALSQDTLDVVSRWEVRGAGRFLEVTPDGATACVMAARGSGWSLIVLDVGAGVRDAAAPASARTLALPFTPQASTLMPDREAPGGVRLVVASAGRLTTFVLDPPAPSWFYQSPGDHHAVRPLPDDRALAALRDEALVLFEPAQRPREQGRVRLTQDDATRVIPLPGRGEDLAVAAVDGATAGIAVLHGGGMALSWFDPRDGRLLEERALATPRLLLAQGRGALLLSAAGEDQGPALRETAAAPALPPPPQQPAMPDAAASIPAPPQPESERPSAAAALPKTVNARTPPESPPAGEPASPAVAPRAAPGPPAQKTDVEPAEGRAAAAGTPPDRSEPPPAASAALPKPVPVLAPPAPPRADTRPFLSGRVTGETGGAREVLVYGPGNILKLHARVPLEPGGLFRLPLPPPGSYRILIAPEPGSHVFTRPEFRTVLVAPGGGGLSGIDFEVRGAL